MKIAVVYATDFGDIAVGGIQNFAFLVGSQAPGSMEVTYFGVGRPARMPRDQDGWHPVLIRPPPRGKLNPRFVRELPRLSNAFRRFDRIVIHRPEYALGVPSGRTVGVLHGGTWNAWRTGRRMTGSAYVAAEMIAAARCCGLVSVDPSGAMRLTRLMSQSLSAVRVPVDPIYVRKVPAPARRRLLSVSRLEPEKRVDLIIELSRMSGWPLLVVGDGRDEGRLRRLVVAMGADVEFAGRLGPKELVNVYGEGGTFVACGLAEGYPLACVEAMVSGLPAVALTGAGLTQLAPYGLHLCRSLQELNNVLGSVHPAKQRLAATVHSSSAVAAEFWRLVVDAGAESKAARLFRWSKGN
jgi:glycosyltransferase involved in cell wall biosynthesis